MKLRTSALIICAILLCAAALALTAQDIDNCCFVDRQCSTDQEWTDGYHAYQNNQCPASSQSGMSAPSQPSGGAPAQIDNCCFVDRQCRNDLEWEAGYHAWQNNQCGAPGSSPASSSYQPGGGVILRTASGVVMGDARGRTILPSTSPTILPGLGQSVFTNNCCQDNWQCNNDQDWAAGYKAFQNDQCGLPGLISVVGEPDFVAYYEQMLEVLKNRLPQRYDYVLNGLDKIEQRQEHGGRGVISSGRRTFFMRWDGPADGVWGAGWDTREPAVLVHEACHVYRSNAGYGITQCDHEAWTREEVLCRTMELEVLIELDAAPHVIDWVRANLAETRTGRPGIEHVTYGGRCQV
ncbi:MAG: hypothetical protein OXN94_16665 [Chloroflexota bacterium]|nr:hypothetical protein [Chloroflexota bacterium]MDE2859480.1 hypothetical protein [Chloroflexota bacterium]